MFNSTHSEFEERVALCVELREVADEMGGIGEDMRNDDNCSKEHHDKLSAFWKKYSGEYDKEIRSLADEYYEFKGKAREYDELEKRSERWYKRMEELEGEKEDLKYELEEKEKELVKA